MSEVLTAEGYEQTKQKLSDMETRWTEIEKRTDLDPKRVASPALALGRWSANGSNQSCFNVGGRKFPFSSSNGVECVGTARAEN